MKLFLGLVAALITPVALACFSPPISIKRDHASLVAEARAIAVVKAVGDDTGQGCWLRVVRTLKGDLTREPVIQCRLPASGDWMTSYSAHTDESFWSGRMGRLGVKGDCSVIAPAFEVGRTYLVLIAKADTKQFEQIDGADDKWLQFVENRLSAVHPRPHHGDRPTASGGLQ